MRNLSHVLIIVGMTSFFVATLGLSAWYRDNRPPKPDPESGRTYIHHIRGPGDVYVSRVEQLIFEGLTYGGFLLAIIGGGMLSRRKDGVA
jgi:hypothetical protein